jgi:lipopolysaccharide transport system permease protein
MRRSLNGEALHDLNIASACSSPGAPSSIPTVVIQSTRGWASLGLRAVWEYRELLYFLLWREVKGRYRQMAFGPLWIIIQPLINMVVLSLIFGKLFALPSDGVPYPIFTYVALLPWQFFALGLRTSAGSLLSQQTVISKVYFPRLIIPLSTVLSAFVDFLASFVVLIFMLIVYRMPLRWEMLTLPYFILLAGATALAVGLSLAGPSVKYRDISLMLGFSVTIWQYLTPVAYSTTLIATRWPQFLTLYKLNPMTGVVDGFRWALLDAAPAPDWTLAVSSAAVLALLVTGAFSFRRTERTIVDVL